MELSDASLVKINRLHDCHILNFDSGTLKGVQDFEILFNEKSQTSSLELKLQSQGLTTHREIQKHIFDSFGDNMNLNMNLNQLSQYIVKIRANIFVEEDPNQNCRNYPTSEFSSYTECDDQYVRKKLEQIAPGLNLTPVWMTDDLDLVTAEPLPAKNRTFSKDSLSEQIM